MFKKFITDIKKAVEEINKQEELKKPEDLKSKRRCMFAFEQIIIGYLLRSGYLVQHTKYLPLTFYCKHFSIIYNAMLALEKEGQHITEKTIIMEIEKSPKYFFAIQNSFHRRRLLKTMSEARASVFGRSPKAFGTFINSGIFKLPHYNFSFDDDEESRCSRGGMLGGGDG